MSGPRRERAPAGPRRPLPRSCVAKALLAASAPLLSLGGAAQAAGLADWQARQLAVTRPAAANAERGFAVVSDGNFAAVGARFDGPNGGGTVYLFRWDGAKWVELLDLIDDLEGDQFGISLALHVGRLSVGLAVGAAGEQRAQERPGGTVYLFHFGLNEAAVKRGMRIERVESIADLPAGKVTLGRALALDDSWLAVSATVHGAAGDDGQVLVDPLPLDRTKEKLLVPDVQQPGDRFGESLALSDSGQLIVGAPGRGDNSNQPAAGAVFRFIPDAGSPPGWHQVETLLRAADPAPHAEFGASLAVSGSTVVVGAPGANAAPAAGGAVPGGDGDLRGPGAVYVFACDGVGDCVPQAELTPASSSAGDRFGQAVSVQGSLLVGGAPLHAAAGVPATGAAFAFHQQDATGKSVWVELGELPGSGTVPNALFGFAVAQSAGTVLVGAPLAGGRAGGISALTAPPVPVPLAVQRRPAAGRPQLDSVTSGRGAAPP